MVRVKFLYIDYYHTISWCCIHVHVYVAVMSFVYGIKVIININYLCLLALLYKQGQITQALVVYRLVAGSVGPYGACQHDASEYHGRYVDGMSESELIDWHRPRIEVSIL